MVLVELATGTIVADPDEVANARWWKAEYGVQAPV